MSDKIKQMKNGWIFVEPMEEKREIGGIIIPDGAQDVTQMGKVVNYHEAKRDSLHQGAVVLFKRRAAFKNIEINGKKLNVMRKRDILGVVTGEGVTDVQPINDFVFLDWEQAPSLYANSNLVRADAFKQMHYTGYVVCKSDEVTEVNVGERVFFDQFCGVEKFQENGRRYGFVREYDIYCTGLPERRESDKKEYSLNGSGK